MKQQDYIFFGSPRFARLVLEGVLETLPPRAVVTSPDRPAGRKRVLTPPAVKSFLHEKHSSIEVLQPERPKFAVAHLKELAPEAFLVAAYGYIIPQSVLDIPRLGTIGVHPSLLPCYRGASPIQSAILGGERKTGVTLYLMDAEMDHGPILAQEELEIGSMDYLELEAALAALGAKLLRENLPKFLDGRLRGRTQDESRATFTKKFETADGFVPWEELERAVNGGAPDVATQVWRKIRALNPEPGAWTEKGEVRIKLVRADLEEDRLVLREIQRAGKTTERISRPLP